MPIETFVSRRQAEVLEELTLHLRHATGGTLLIAAANDVDSQRRLIHTLVQRLAGEIDINAGG